MMSKPEASQPKSLLLQWPESLDSAFVATLADKHMIKVVESLPHPEMAAFRSRRLTQLLSHAVQNSEWWRQRIGKKATVEFQGIPLTTRADLRSAIEQQGGALPLPQGHGHSFSASTSGSSGVPVQFFSSAIASRLNAAYYWVDRERHQIDPRKTMARFSVHLDVHEGEHLAKPGSRELMRSPELHRRPQQFSVEQHALWLAKMKPAYIIGHPTLLAGILDAYEEGLAKAPVVESLLTYAETLTPAFRDQARRVLGAKTLDRYSSQEVGPIAFQCPVSDDHYHVATANVFVEVLDAEGRQVTPGETGRLYVTSLHNFATPIVRYELGDLGAWLPRCVCGHEQTVLLNLLGRERFLIKLPSGERRYVNFGARHWLKVIPVSEARLVQKREGVLTAEFAMDRAITLEEKHALVRLLQDEVSSELSYELSQVPRIDWGSSYKRQDVVSLI